MDSFLISKLEKQFSFQFQDKNTFESPDEKKELQKKGFEMFAAKQVKEDWVQYGRKYKTEISEMIMPSVCIHQINNTIGSGLFAEKDYPTGTYFGEYIGLVRKNNRRYTEPLNDYCYEYPVVDNLNRNYVIDATRGHLTRFINHNFDPNLRPYYAYLDGFFHIIFISVKRIKKGDQLSYNYGRQYWYLRSKPSKI